MGISGLAAAGWPGQADVTVVGHRGFMIAHHEMEVGRLGVLGHQGDGIQDQLRVPDDEIPGSGLEQWGLGGRPLAGHGNAASPGMRGAAGGRIGHAVLGAEHRLLGAADHGPTPGAAAVRTL